MTPSPLAAVALPTTVTRPLPTHAPRVPGRHRVAPWLVVVAASAVSGPGAAPTSVEQAWSAVEALVDTPRCRVDSDCRTIGVGSRACGGPERFVAWSALVTDAVALNDAVARHAALRQAVDEKA